MKIIKITSSLMLLVITLAAAVSYSWTFTPSGRLDYKAAAWSKLATLQTTPPQYSEEARHTANKLLRDFKGLPDPSLVAAIDDYIISTEQAEISVRVYTPKGDDPFPLLFEIHGGGWRMGNDFVMEKPVVEMAAAIPAVAVSVDYRLAPEHPYPAALDDSSAALYWAVAQAGKLNIDPSRIAVTGSSAGGNLAAALTLKIRDEDGPSIRFQYLNVPSVDLANGDWPSYREAADNYLLKVSAMEVMIEDYVPDPARRREPLVSPLLAASHANLPPALIVTAQFDPLRDQGKAYANKLSAAGVETS